MPSLPESACMCVRACESWREIPRDRGWKTENGRRGGGKKKGGKKKSLETRRCKSAMVVLNYFELFVQLT